MKQLTRETIIFCIYSVVILIAVILLSRDPFSGQNAISQIEPSPDSVHYLSPVKSLFEGHGFAITYQDRSLPTSVPPLYSITVIPFYWLFSDIRSFYFLNVFLLILSDFIFLKILIRAIKSKLMQIILFLAFSLNAFLLWYIQFPMAEVLLIFLFNCALLVLTYPVTLKRIILTGILAGLMYSTKYVAWVTGGTLILIYGYRIFLSYEKKEMIKPVLILFVTAVLTLVVSIFVEYLAKGKLAYDTILANVQGVLHLLGPRKLVQTSDPAQSLHPSFYSATSFGDNFTRYLNGIVGGEVTVAGSSYNLVSPVVGMVNILGVILLLIIKHNRALYFYIISSILIMLFYISTFQTVDARYFFVFIPGLILLFGLSIEALGIGLEKIGYSKFQPLIVGLASLALVASLLPGLINVFRANIFHSDASENYQAISVMNSYFENVNPQQRPTVITVLSPYQIDFFSNHNYELLPLSKLQNFTDSEPQTWNIQKGLVYQDIYKAYVAQDKPLFVLAYHVGDDYIFQRDFHNLQQNFYLRKVSDGCNGECDLYQIDSPLAYLSY
jgi:hypothetical protein